jgi:GntR family transcriptional regulator / MocR family aminotransferase
VGPGAPLFRHDGASPLLTLKLERSGSETLQRQIFAQVRDAILAGHLAPGSELPASRLLANQYHVSRNTVLQAYEWLMSEGYLEAQRGTRTFVTFSLPEHCLLVDRSVVRGNLDAPRGVPKTPVLFQGERPELFEKGPTKAKIDFWPGRPNRAHFPLYAIKKLVLERISNASRAFTEYGDAAGMHELRAAIARHLDLARGFRVEPSQIFVTAGIQEALNIVCRLFVQQGTPVGVENPCYNSAALIFKSYGASLTPIEVDQDGMRVDRIGGLKARLIYVTPSHQFPTGVTLSLERRLRLLEWAQNTGAYLLEDDYDSDFRYFGPPLTALAGLDTSRSVIYLGTFSKSIGAGLRTGFLVVPPQLVESTMTVKTLLNYGHPWAEQALLTDFLNSRTYQRHLRRIRRAYSAIRDYLLDELKKTFGEVEIWGAETGMHVMWKLPEGFPTAQAFASATRAYGVRIHTLESAGAYDVASGYDSDSIVLGYSALTKDEIKAGVHAMHRALLDLRGATSSGRRGCGEALSLTDDHMKISTDS